MTDPETTLSTLDEIVDDLLPGDLDWRRLVVTYPIPALVVATAGGFWLGRKRGPELVAALSSFVTDQVTKNVHAVLDEAG
jgi:hypothetical protein